MNCGSQIVFVFNLLRTSKQLCFQCTKWQKTEKTKRAFAADLKANAPHLVLFHFVKKQYQTAWGIGFLDPTFSGSGGPMMCSPLSPASSHLRTLVFVFLFTFTFYLHFFIRIFPQEVCRPSFQSLTFF